MNADETLEIKNLLSGADEELYAWLVNENIIDLYKLHKLLYYTKSDEILCRRITMFLQQHNLFHFIPNFITKGVVEFYKGKMCNIHYSTLLMQREYLETCGVQDIHPYGAAKNLNKDGIKYILQYHGVDVNNVGSVKFLIQCKEFGYNKQKIINETKITKEFYDMVDNNYYEYLCKQTTYQQYLAHKQFTTDSIACMEFIKALENSAADTNSDAVVSADTINSIIVGANVNRHLNSSS